MERMPRSAHPNQIRDRAIGDTVEGVRKKKSGLASVFRGQPGNLSRLCPSLKGRGVLGEMPRARLRVAGLRQFSRSFLTQPRNKGLSASRLAPAAGPQIFGRSYPSF